ncbi:hypothetical protein GCM10025772_24140 [Ferrimonas gelatinilytica]|uniref:DUF2970 domain-containing protein n=1 Tax=Ferrimonas gelatinilytica TaxID=1255257 RepID=A0ABP9SBV6_9GAMM
MLSVLAALFGVQSESNRRRDFQASSAKPFILTGLVVIVLFVLALIGVVQWVIPR